MKKNIKKGFILLSLIVCFSSCKQIKNVHSKNIIQSEDKDTSIDVSENQNDSNHKKEILNELKNNNDQNENQVEDSEDSNEKMKSHNGKFNSISYDVVKIKKLMEDSDYSGEKIAFLTFDDGPNSTLTPKILDILKEYNIPGTFFVLGKVINDDTKDVLKRIYEEGHSIGTHTYTHDYDILYPNRNADPDTILEEETQVLNKIRKYLGKNFFSRVFRYPGGHMSWNYDSLKMADDLLAEYDIHWLDWNTMTGDAQPKDADHIPRPNNIQEVLNNFDESKIFATNPDVAVILMHDAEGKELTVEALPYLINHLKEQGYSFGVLE